MFFLLFISVAVTVGVSFVVVRRKRKTAEGTIR